jgi:LPXTG-motif cell wall-anchored protein
VSEQPTTTRAAAPARGPQVKHLGLTRNQWLLTGGIAIAAGLLFYLYRRNKANAANAATATTAATASGSGQGTCADGSTVPCGGLCADGSTPSGCDQSGDLSTLQTEIGQLQSALGQGASGGGSGGVVTTPVTPNPTTPAPATTTSPAATSTSTGASTSTTAAKKTAGPISNLQASAGKTTAKVSWHAAADATAYSWILRDLHTRTQVKAATTVATSVSLSGLTSKTSYNFGVQGLPGGPGNNVQFTTT